VWGGGYDIWRRDNEEGNAGYKSLSNLYNEFVPGCFSECTGTTYSAYQGGLGESVGHTRFGAGLGITSFGGVMMRRAMPPAIAEYTIVSNVFELHRYLYDEVERCR
jgi:hypothetical protein